MLDHVVTYSHVHGARCPCAACRLHGAGGMTCVDERTRVPEPMVHHALHAIMPRNALAFLCRLVGSSSSSGFYIRVPSLIRLIG